MIQILGSVFSPGLYLNRPKPVTGTKEDHNPIDTAAFFG